MLDKTSDNATNDNGPREVKRVRASRGRGLRTNKGCLTCRHRRLKCNESKPACGQCQKSQRECRYASDLTSHVSRSSPKEDSSHVADADSNYASTDATAIAKRSHLIPASNNNKNSSIVPGVDPFTHDAPQYARQQYIESFIANQHINNDLQESPYSISPSVSRTSLQLREPQIYVGASSVVPNVSPTTVSSSITPGQAPYEWWDLVAQDAAKNEDQYQALKDSHSRWSFDPVDLSRSAAPSPGLFVHGIPPPPRSPSVRQMGSSIGAHHDIFAKEPWNTMDHPMLSSTEVLYLRYYVDTVAPIFDLFDPSKTFTEIIPHLAMRNVGLLRSVLAVSARFKSLHTSSRPVTEPQPADANTSFEDHESGHDFASTHFYFETLTYLSQAMRFPSYTRSREILATAALISAYEYFHIDRSADWERHLKGVFWIQRSQETNGERDGVEGAVWWAWLRQDIWAALWQRRKPLTIWEPRRSLGELNSHDFASRATFLLARAVKYAMQESEDSADMTQRRSDADRHLNELQEWYDRLKPTYKPLPIAASTNSMTFPPVWIHPPYQAAAMQQYYSAKILILLHRPSTGGVNAYHDVRKAIDEAVEMICGLAQSPTALQYPSAMVHFQALYVAGQAVRTPEHQTALYDIFDRVLDYTKFPTKSLLDDLNKLWSS